MKKWPCNQCLVKVVCNKPCEDYLNETAQCMDITNFGDGRYTFLYYGEVVYGPYIKTFIFKTPEVYNHLSKDYGLIKRRSV